jgi:saccharopine dehydrogenase (NAD+, L-lysine forming)
MFGHVFKHQKGWQHNLNRFKLGKGELLDLEFLTFDDKNRVAAFGKSAGYAGMATGFLVWIHQHLKGLNVPFPALEA